MKIDRKFRRTSESFPIQQELSREDYMSGKVTHDQYYNQFVTQDILDIITVSVGTEDILASKDPNFNDIALYRWDRCGVLLEGKVNWPKDDGPSTAGLVCVAKAGAKEFLRLFEGGNIKLL